MCVCVVFLDGRSNMAILRTCCCWFNTRNGSIACGIYTLVLSMVSSGLVIYNISQLLEYHSIMGATENHIKIAVGLFYATIAVCAALFLSSIILIVGIHKDRRHMLIPWMCSSVFLIIIDATAVTYDSIVFGFFTFNILQMVIFVALTLLNIYCIMCVASQYSELKNGRGTLEYIQSQRQSSPVIYRVADGQHVMAHNGSVLLLPVNGGVVGQNSFSSLSQIYTADMTPPPPVVAADTPLLPSPPPSAQTQASRTPNATGEHQPNTTLDESVTEELLTHDGR